MLNLHKTFWYAREKFEIWIRNEGLSFPFQFIISTLKNKVVGLDTFSDSLIHQFCEPCYDTENTFRDAWVVQSVGHPTLAN